MRSKRNLLEELGVACQPKDFCGMGFRYMEYFNLALLAKQRWQLIKNPSSLACQVIKCRYFPHTSLMKAKRDQNLHIYEVVYYGAVVSWCEVVFGGLVMANLLGYLYIICFLHLHLFFFLFLPHSLPADSLVFDLLTPCVVGICKKYKWVSMQIRPLLYYYCQWVVRVMIIYISFTKWSNNFFPNLLYLKHKNHLHYQKKERKNTKIMSINKCLWYENSPFSAIY